MYFCTVQNFKLFVCEKHYLSKGADWVKILYFYRCDGCEELHQNEADIFKCSVCGAEICTECSEDDKCIYYCEPKQIV